MKKENESINTRGIIRAILIGAIIGYALYETGVADAVASEIREERQQYHEKCGDTYKEQQDRCPSNNINPFGMYGPW